MAAAILTEVVTEKMIQLQSRRCAEDKASDAAANGQRSLRIMPGLLPA
jgi:hypothetical protein